MSTPQLRFHKVEVNGVNLHYGEAGPTDGQIVFLLHGFPEFWYAWRRQIEILSAAGYRVFAIDQRGYNLSDKPTAVADYDLDVLGADIVGLADAVHARKFTVIGHDWGAAVGWWIASHRPDRIARLIAISAPHPAVWKAAMENDPEQRRLSGYVRFFNNRGLPELVIRLSAYGPLLRALKDNTTPTAFNERDFDEYRKAWSQPGALTGMLNWYRAIMARKLNVPQSYRVTVPVLLIWGSGEKYAVRRLAQASIGLCDNGHLTFVEKASHWPHHEQPERLKLLLLDFLQGRAPR